MIPASRRRSLALVQTARASKRRAALAAFLLFAAALLVVGPAEASRTTTDARPGLTSTSPDALAPSSLELAEPIDPSPRFGFAEDLSLLDLEARPCGFELFGGVETSRFELTYARNNPLKYVDPDGRAAVPVDVAGFRAAFFSASGAIRDAIREGIGSVPAVPGGPSAESVLVMGAASDAYLSFWLPRNNSEVVANANAMAIGMAFQSSAVIPDVADAKLGNIVGDLFKGARTRNPIGTGSTADAVRSEVATGLPVGGKFHAGKAKEYSTALEKWLSKNPSASSRDRLVARSLVDDLKEALQRVADPAGPSK